jgi:ABC-2 type transport system ATP-binding protein
MPAAIAVHELDVAFAGRDRTGRVQALRGVSFAVPRGAVLGILGPNGSGKTTLLRTLAGLQRPTGGSVQLLGEASHAPELRRRVAFQPEGQLPLTVLSAPEMLAYVGAQLGLANAESDRRAAHWLDRLDLRHAGNRRAGTFSTGMQKRLALAMALLAEPEVLLLDEPTSGLDPFGSEAVVAILRELAAGGTTIVLASHHLLEVEECCDELLVLQGGEVRAHGRRADLLATGETALLLRGLDENGLERLAEHATALGAVDVHRRPARGSLFDLLRRVAKGRRDS